MTVFLLCGECTLRSSSDGGHLSGLFPLGFQVIYISIIQALVGAANRQARSLSWPGPIACRPFPSLCPSSQHRLQQKRSRHSLPACPPLVRSDLCCLWAFGVGGR
eukprot:768113-Hanusia_phi.AAC.3